MAGKTMKPSEAPLLQGSLFDGASVRESVIKDILVGSLIEAPPDSDQLLDELAALPIPPDTPTHVVHTVMSFAMDYGVYPPAIRTMDDEEALLDWVDRLDHDKKRFGTRTAQKELAKHEDVLRRLAERGHGAITIAHHLGCRTENVTHFLSKLDIDPKGWRTLADEDVGNDVAFVNATVLQIIEEARAKRRST